MADNSNKDNSNKENNKQTNEKKPWIKLGITEELYKDISETVAKDLKSDIKQEIINEMNKDTIIAEAAVNKGAGFPEYINKFINENKEFRVRLNKRAGIWQTPDKSIDLSIFPDQHTHKSKTLSNILTADNPWILNIKAAVATETLRFENADAKEEQISFDQYSKGAEHTKNNTGAVPDNVRKLLNNPEAQIPSLLKDIKNIRHLKVLLNLERQASSVAHRTRPNVISALNARIRELPVAETSLIGGGQLTAADVTEEMPEDYKEKEK